MKKPNTKQDSDTQNTKYVKVPFFVLFFLCNIANKLYSVEYITYTNPAEYEIEHSAVVHNQGITTLTSLELNLPIPEQWPELSVHNITVEGDDVLYLKNTEGPGKLIRSFYKDGDLPVPGEEKTLKITYHTVVKEIKTRKYILHRKTYQPYKIDDEYNYYTRSEKMIESDYGEIIRIAKELKKNAKSPYQFAQAAYDYVIDNITYKSPSPSWGAKECITKKEGDCGQFAALFVAICRAEGIPARPVAGCWCQGNNPWHCWAEFKLPEIGWIPVDPTRGARGGAKRKYYFGSLDNNHLPLVKSYNMELQTSKGKKKMGFLQVGAWYWYRTGRSTGKKISAKFKMHGKKSPIDNLIGAPDYSAPVYRQLQKASKKKRESDFYGAIQLCLGVIKNTKADRKYIAQAYYQIGMCYLEKGDSKKAVEYLEYLTSHFSEQSACLKRAKRELEKIEPTSSH